MKGLAKTGARCSESVTAMPMAPLFLALLLMLLMRPAASETIQLERQHGTYMVLVRINEAVTLPFVLDTGASEVAIPTDVFLTLIRTGTVKKSDFIGPGTYVLADGSETSSDRFVLHEVRVGDHVVRNVIANVAPVKGDPLLGQSFLSKLPAWTIDNQRHALVLNDTTGPVGAQQTKPARVPSLQQAVPSVKTPGFAPAPDSGLPIGELGQRADQALAVKKYADAMRWWRMAAAQGDAVAQYNIGTLYAKGWGVPQHYAEAMRWFRMAAAQGIAEAQISVGWLYAKGWGVPQDCAVAKQWLDRAAVAGNDWARNSLRNGANDACQW
jgi:hypothetical protein